jgi:hypothetical protein
MTTATVLSGAFYRTFSEAESSAIRNLHVEPGSVLTGAPGFVEVIFHRNPTRAYGFDADPAFTADLFDVLGYTDLRGESLGRMIARARQDGRLQAIPEEV